MSKQPKHKTPVERPVSANAVDYEPVVHDLYRRGLVSQSALEHRGTWRKYRNASDRLQGELSNDWTENREH